MQNTLSGAGGALLATIVQRFLRAPSRWIERVDKRLERIERKLRSVEGVAADALHNVAEVRQQLEERQRRGGQRWYDPGTPWRNRELYDQERRDLDP